MIVLFNKPYGVLCQFRDDEGRPTLGDYLDIPGIYAAGRLDRDSEGLLVLTDDGQLQQRLSDPQFKQPKTYLVQVEGVPSVAQMGKLRQGVRLNDGPTRPAEAHLMAGRPGDLWPRQPPVRQRKKIPTRWLELTLREGRNRQVRRMTAAVGLPTLRLIRTAVAGWQLDGLQPGEWREVDPADR